MFTEKKYNKEDIIKYCNDLIKNPPKYPIIKQNKLELRDYQIECKDLIINNKQNIVIQSPRSSGTSQAPVREALRDLQLLRLVESEPFRGSRVRVFDEEELIEVYPVRASLEELAARLAAEKLEGDVSALEVEFEAMRDAVRADDTNALAQHDIAFHRLIVEAAGNSVLEQCWKSLGVESRITISLYGTYMDPEQAAERHVKLIDAIRSGKARRREARKHVEVSARLMRGCREARVTVARGEGRAPTLHHCAPLARDRLPANEASRQVMPTRPPFHRRRRRAPARARPDPARLTQRPTATLVALFLAALTLRPQIVGIGPLIPSIQEAFGTSHAVVGLLGTIPVLCMGLFAPVAAYLAARIGTRRAMTIGLALIGVFGVLRATMPSVWLVVLLTWPVGIGMGFGNAIAPISVKEHFEERPGFGTGVYTTGIQVGSTSAAALAVPLAGWLYGWRGALIAISCVALLSLIAWVVLTWGDTPHTLPPSRCRGCRGAAARPGSSSPSSASWPRPTTASTRGFPMRTPSAAGARAAPASCSR